MACATSGIHHHEGSLRPLARVQGAFVLSTELEVSNVPEAAIRSRNPSTEGQPMNDLTLADDRAVDLSIHDDIDKFVRDGF